MNFSNATNEQLKNIIEWDEGCIGTLLYPIYEECVKRDLYDAFITGFLIKLFLSVQRAEKLTKMNYDELKWFSYEQGFEAMKKFKPGNRPFIALWSNVIKRGLIELVRKQNAQKRTAEIFNIDEMVLNIPMAHHDTEKTAINRVYIDSILNNLRPKEKEIVLARYQGYTLKEIGRMQGVSRSGIQKRINLYLKRLKEIGGVGMV